MAEKMNMVEKFQAVIAILEGAESTMTRAEAVEFLADRAEKAKSKPRARKENPELVAFRAAVATVLAEAEGAMTAGEVAEAMGEGISTQKASAALRFLVGEGAAEVVPGAKAKDAKRYAAVMA